MNGKNFANGKISVKREWHPLEAYIWGQKMSVPEFAALCRLSPPTILRIIKNEKYGYIQASKKTIKKILKKAPKLTWKDFGYAEEN